MYCHNCGKQLVNNTRFCISCGAPSAQPSAPTMQQPQIKKKKQRKGLIAIICFVLLIAGASFVFFMLQNESQENGQSDISMSPATLDDTHASDTPQQGTISTDPFAVGNTSGNLRNFGLVAMHGDRIIFTDIYNSQTEIRGGLYSMNLDGSDINKLSYDMAISLNVIGDRILYLNMTGGLGIYSINSDGSGRRRISRSPGFSTEHAMSINVVGDRIFFVDQLSYHRIYSMNFDGDDIQRISDEESVFSINVADGRIFFTKFYWRDEFQFVFIPVGFYSMNIDGSDIRRLSEYPMVRIINVDDYIFFINTGDEGNLLYSMNTDGSNKRRLSDSSVFSFNVADNRIFFTNADNFSNPYNYSGIYSMNFDGSDKRSLSDFFASYINIGGDRIFFLSTGDRLYSMNFDGSDVRPLN